MWDQRKVMNKRRIILIHRVLRMKGRASTATVAVEVQRVIYIAEVMTPSMVAMIRISAEEVLKAKTIAERSRIPSGMIHLRTSQGGLALVRGTKTGKRRMIRVRSGTKGSLRRTRRQMETIAASVGTKESLQMRLVGTQRGAKTSLATIAKSEGGLRATRRARTAGIKTKSLKDQRTRIREIANTVVTRKGIESATRSATMTETGIVTGIEKNLLHRPKAKVKAKTGKTANRLAESLETRNGTTLKKSVESASALREMVDRSVPPKPHRKGKIMALTLLEVTKVEKVKHATLVKKNARRKGGTTIARQVKTSLTTLEATSGISSGVQATKRTIRSTKWVDRSHLKARSAIQSGDDLHRSRNHRHLTTEVARVKTGRTKRRATIITRTAKNQPKGSSRRGSTRTDMEAITGGVLEVAVRTASGTISHTLLFQVRARAHRSSRSKSQAESTNEVEDAVATTITPGLGSGPAEAC